MSELLAGILERLEQFHGPQQPHWPTEPYEFLIWWHCGYPASDAACARGWDALNRTSGIQPTENLEAGTVKLAGALKAGGMVPELRAMRLIEIASRVQQEFGGDLRRAYRDASECPEGFAEVSQHCRSGRGPHSLVWRSCTGAGGAVQLPARAGAHPAGAGTRKLRRDVPVCAKSHRGGDAGRVRRAYASLPAAEVPRPATVQTHQSEMRTLPGQRMVCVLQQAGTDPLILVAPVVIECYR